MHGPRVRVTRNLLSVRMAPPPSDPQPMIEQGGGHLPPYRRFYFNNFREQPSGPQAKQYSEANVFSQPAVDHIQCKTASVVALGEGRAGRYQHRQSMRAILITPLNSPFPIRQF